MKGTSISVRALVVAALLGLMFGCKAQAPQEVRQSASVSIPSPGVLHAQFYDSGFSLADDNYNACFRASDGKIYYVLASGSVDTGAQMYSFDPATKTIQHIGDLTEAAGEKGLHAIPQGKGHSLFVESNGKLYFATHIGYYNPPTSSGLELIGKTPRGYKPYPGGHFLSYDLATHKFTDLAKAPSGEGIISFAMDTQRQRLYGLTWPSGIFVRYDMRTHNFKTLGSAFLKGERGIPGKTFHVICRSLVVDPEDGSVYFTTGDGNIMEYRYDTDSVGRVEGASLKKDIFGCLNPSEPGTMAYNWRQAFWYAPQKVVYGVHGRSGYLFRFDPRTRDVKVITRLVSDQTRASGMYDKNKYGYLGFTLGPDGHTIYYLTGAGSEAGPDQIHFVSYDILSKKSIDHGALQLPDGRRPFAAQSIAIDGDKMVYSIVKVKVSQPTGHRGDFKIDLLSFPNPVAR